MTDETTKKDMWFGLVHAGSKAEVSVVIDGVSRKFTARVNKDGNVEYSTAERSVDHALGIDVTFV